MKRNKIKQLLMKNVKDVRNGDVKCQIYQKSIFQ